MQAVLRVVPVCTFEKVVVFQPQVQRVHLQKQMNELINDRVKIVEVILMNSR